MTNLDRILKYKSSVYALGEINSHEVDISKLIDFDDAKSNILNCMKNLAYADKTTNKKRIIKAVSCMIGGGLAGAGSILVSSIPLKVAFGMMAGTCIAISSANLTELGRPDTRKQDKKLLIEAVSKVDGLVEDESSKKIHKIVDEFLQLC